METPSALNSPLTSHRIPQSNLIPRLAVQLSSLSLSDRHITPSTAWSLLESLPPEILAHISSNLAFFDKKALASTSHRIYDLMPPLFPSDRFSWRLHVCTSLNRVPDPFFDTTIFKAQELRREVRRLVKQTPEPLTRAHHVFEPESTRLKDLSCLYFPNGFQTECGDKQILCRTLGQFIAIQFEEYMARIIRVSKEGEALALNRRYLIPFLAFTDEHKKNLAREARKWKKVHDIWLTGESPSGKSSDDEDRTPMPSLSAWEYSRELLSRMGIEVVQGRLCMHGRICEVGVDQGIEIRKASGPTEDSEWDSDDDCWHRFLGDGEYEGAESLEEEDDEGSEDHEGPEPQVEDDEGSKDNEKDEDSEDEEDNDDPEDYYDPEAEGWEA